MPQYGYKFNRVLVDSTLHIPSYCGVPSITDYIKNGMIAIDTCNNVLFQWTRANGWTPISTGTYLDTTSLSNRINQRVKYTDTSAMLLPYLKKIDTTAMLNRYLRKSDTASLSNRINLKLNISDTSSMLSKYLRIFDTTSMLSKYLRRSDTTEMLSGYVRKSTTISTTAPLTGGGSLAANRTISIPKATGLVDGYMDADDFDRFAYALGRVSAQEPLYRIRYANPTLGFDSVRILARQVNNEQDGYLTYPYYNYFHRKVDTLYKVGDTLICLKNDPYKSIFNRDTFKIFIGGGGGSSIDTTNRFVNNVVKLNDSTISVYKGTGFANITLNSGKIDSLRRSNDSIFARKNGTFVFQYKDTLGDDTATVVIAQVYNAEATTLNRGEVVYLYGSNGDRASVKRANNKGDSASSKTFGFVRENILAGGIGYITTQGQIGKLNLGAYTAGQTIYLDSIAGQFTATKPSAPYHLVTLGVIERANNGNGLIYVKPANGFELDELHNVQLNGTKKYSLLYYDSTNKLWKATDSIYAFQGKYLGIGTYNPSTLLDVIKGGIDEMPRKYEIANFVKNGEIKVGIYNSGTYASGTGSAITLGNTKNLNVNGNYPAFEIQNINDSASWDNSVLRYNYFERDISGTIATANVDLFNVYADGTVKMNASTFGSSATSRFIIGADQGETFNVDGTSYITGNSTFDGNIYNTNSGAFYSGKINRMLVEINDGITTNYSVAQTDHIIIASTDNDNITITLPEADDGNQSGRELIIKQKGDVASYTLTIDGQGFYIDGSTPRDVAVGADGNYTIKIVCNGNEWFLLQGAFQ